MALKTNSKKARENIRQYILKDEYIYECAEFDGVKLDREDADQVLDYVWESFKKQMSADIERNGNHSSLDIFRDWARGLALGTTFNYYYSTSANEILRKILEQTREQAVKYTEDESEETLTRLIFRELGIAHLNRMLKQ